MALFVIILTYIRDAYHSILSSRAVLLHALLLQNCQPDSLATEEESLVAGFSSSSLATRWRASGAPLATQLLPVFSSPSTTVTHQPTALSLPLLPVMSLPTTFAGTSPSAGIRFAVSMTFSPPTSSHKSPYRSFAVFTGDLVLFQSVGSQ